MRMERKESKFLTSNPPLMTIVNLKKESAASSKIARWESRMYVSVQYGTFTSTHSRLCIHV